MEKFGLVLLLGLYAALSAHASSEGCANNGATIRAWACSTSKADTIQKQADALVAQAKSLALTKPAAEKIETATKAILDPLTPSDVERLFQTTRDAIISNLKSQQGADPSATPVMIDELLKTKLVYGLNLDDSTRPKFIEYCGKEGLDESAHSVEIFDHYNDHGIDKGIDRGNIFIICGGLLARAKFSSLKDPIMSLTHIVGHELGHVIHGVKNLAVYDIYTESGQKVMTNFVPFYSKYASCLKANYLTALAGGGTMEINQEYITFLKKTLGHAPDRVDTHMAEVNADMWGARVMATFLEQSESLRAEAALFVSENTAAFCDDWLDFGGGIHPNVLFRFGQIFKDPGIRKSLGCGENPAAAPYCGIEGASK